MLHVLCCVCVQVTDVNKLIQPDVYSLSNVTHCACLQLFYREKKEDGRKMKICEEFVDPSSRPQELVTTDVLEVSHHSNISSSIFVLFKYIFEIVKACSNCSMTFILNAKLESALTVLLSWTCHCSVKDMN